MNLREFYNLFRQYLYDTIEGYKEREEDEMFLDSIWDSIKKEKEE